MKSIKDKIRYYPGIICNKSIDKMIKHQIRFLVKECVFYKNFNNDVSNWSNMYLEIGQHILN